MDQLQYSYDQIKYFLVVAKKGSISKGAKELNISQSALTQSIHNLENTLGVTLFTRNARGVILTDVGKTLYDNALPGDEFFKQAIIKTLRQKENLDPKLYKIDASPSIASYYIAPVLRKVIEAYPSINFQITNHTNPSNIIKKVQNNEVNMGIHRTSTDFSSKEIEVKQLHLVHPVFAYNKEYFHFDKDITTKELAQNLIIIKDSTGSYDNAWMQYTFPHYMTSKSDTITTELVKGGVGVGMLPEQICMQDGLDYVYPIDMKIHNRGVFACYNENDEIAKYITKLIISHLNTFQKKA